MKVTPRTDKELKEMNIWQPGSYYFKIIEEIAIGQNLYRTQEAVSKNGNEMIRLVLQVFNDEGHFITILDHLLDSVMPHKLKHAAQACNLLDKYESGELNAEDFIGKTGKLSLGIDKDKSGQYPDRNGVKDYIVLTTQTEEGSLEDEIPF